MVDNDHFRDLVNKILINGEWIIMSFQGYRDGIVLTDKRIIAINIQGATGKKKDLTSIPYKKIQAYSVETGGAMDWDSELVLWMSSVGSVKFQFTTGTDVFSICRIISDYNLK